MGHEAAGPPAHAKRLAPPMSLAVVLERGRTYAGFTKLEHTVFSLPVIFAGTLLHAHRWPSVERMGWIVLAALGARVVAMGLNRLIDVQLDARNPRTRARELPRGAMRRREAWMIVIVAGLLYLVAAASLAPVCVRLASIPVALFVLYPYLKRWTAFAHLGLGLAWSMAPLGGWLAAAQTLQGVGEVGWLWFFSLLWVAGFDIIYATMDEAFDREAGLHSLPARLGRRPALRVAAGLHAAAFVALVILWRTQLSGHLAGWWLAGLAMLLVWQHAVAERRPAFAFFQLNAIAGFVVLGMVAVGVAG